MRGFLEQYGIGIFTLVMIAILIAMASPIGIFLKKNTNTQIKNVDNIGTEEIAKTNGNDGGAGPGESGGGTNRPAKPAEAVDQVWCYIDKDGELVISQEKITAPDDALVKETQTDTPYLLGTSNIKTVRFEGAVMPNRCEMWFYNCRKLTEIKNIENLYTNECTTMYKMFWGCSNLTSLDVSGFDTGNVKTIQAMFDSCSNLTSLDVSGWNTGNVKDMASVFGSCSNLASLDVSGWNTVSVTKMSSMFWGCSSLTSLDVSGFDTGKVKDMVAMFAYCRSLTSLNVSGWNTVSVTNMYDMFFCCSSLTSLDLSGWNTVSVTNMSSMFSDCRDLTSLDLSGLNTENVTKMSSMFSNCRSLTSITCPQSVKDKITSLYGTIYSNPTWTII